MPLVGSSPPLLKMTTLLLLVGIALLISAIFFHSLAQGNVIKVIDRVWYERLFTGSRASKDNLTQEGLRYRKQSDVYAILGFIVIGVYVFIK